MSEKEFHNKICWFTFLYSILVVWIHSCNSELFLGKTQEAQTVARLEQILGSVIAQFAVPGFFMISAYLFYRNFSWQKLGSKWTRRIRSILVPFLVWNFLYYLGYAAASRIPFLDEVVGKGKIPLGWIPAVDAILHYTYNYVFWYLYQLILLVFMAPLLYLLLKRKAAGMVVIVGLWVASGNGMVIPQLNLDALLYYAGGAWMALHHKEVIEGRWNKKKGLAGIMILAVSLGLGAADTLAGTRHLGRVVFSRLFVPFALWMIVPERCLGEAKDWMKYNFFLYATHFAVVRLVNKMAAQVPWRHLMLPLMLYLIMPVLAVSFSYLAGKLLRRYFPLLWTLLNGGRKEPVSDRAPSS